MNIIYIVKRGYGGLNNEAISILGIFLDKEKAETCARAETQSSGFAGHDWCDVTELREINGQFRETAVCWTSSKPAEKLNRCNIWTNEAEGNLPKHLCILKGGHHGKCR